MRADGSRAGDWLFALTLALGATTGCGKAERQGHQGGDAAAAGASGVGSGGSGGSHGGSAGAPIGTPEEQAALARLLASVCTTPDCVAGLDFEVLRVTRGIQAGRLSINPDVVDACLAVGPNVFVFESRTFAPPPECEDLWIPLTSIGGACDTDFACIDGFCERSSYSRSRPQYAAGGCGVCAPRGALGAPCSGHGWTGADRECATGLTCGCPDGTDNCATTCQTYALAGADEHCASPHIDCADGLSCVYAPGTPMGTCQPTLAQGERCTSNDVCPDADCLDMDASGTGHCGPRRTGEACSDDFDCADDSFCGESLCALAREGSRCAYTGSACSDGSVCDGAAMICLPRAGHGDACQSSVQCAEGADCVDGACRLVLGLGALCDPVPTAVDRCASGASCLDGVCTRLRLGDACSAECASGACENGQCVSLAPGTACTSDGYWDGDSCGIGVECGRSMTCEPRPAIGEPCTSDGYCDSGHFCADCADIEDCSMTATCEAICVLEAPGPEAR